MSPTNAAKHETGTDTEFRAVQLDKPLRVALLVNLASNAPPPPADAPHDALAELDSDKTALAYTQALNNAGHEVRLFEIGPDSAAELRAFAPDFCFNTCEGTRGDSREAHAPALLEMMGLRYSGPAPLAAAITNDKPATKRVLHYYGLPTPLFQVFESPDDALHRDLTFPLFVKPAHEGTGMGIGNHSIVRDVRQLRDSVAYALDKYRQPALVETYVQGKDITCGLVGNGNRVHFFPITEVDFSGYPPELEPVYGSLQKTDYDHLYKNKCPAPLGDALTAEVRRLTHETFKVTGCRDYSRVDFMLRDDGTLSILEINGLPGIGPHSDLTLMAKAEGWTHGDLVRSVLNAALLRYGIAQPALVTPA
jgi:D-alanine-D-alanine ligase